jgi:tetratricopeptide (TPR) repeat protein
LKKNQGFHGPPRRQVPSVIQQRQQQALALLQRGMLSDAKIIFEDILKQRPNHFDALHLLGVIACQTKNPLQGEELFSKAIRINPNVAEAYYNRGIALKDLKRLDEAIASYDKAIELKPDYAEAYYNRGNALKDLKRIDEAITSYDKALALRPDLVGTEGDRLHAKMHLCDWTNFDTECEHLTSSVKNEKPNTSPFIVLGISSSPDDKCNVPSCGSQKNALPLKKQFGRVSNIDTIEFILLTFLPTFVSIRCPI